MSALACIGDVWDELTTTGDGLCRNGESFNCNGDLDVSGDAQEMGGHVEMAFLLRYRRVSVGEHIFGEGYAYSTP